MLNAQVLHEKLWLSQIPHLHVEVVTCGEKGGAWPLDKPSTRDRVTDFTIGARLRLQVLDYALDGSLHLG